MKNLLNNLKSNKMLFVQCLLAFLAVMTGGASMAVTLVTTPEDPVNPNTNDMNAPGVDGAGNQNKAGQNLDGTVASATQVRRGDLAEDEVDKDIAEFRPFQFPLDTDIRLQAKQLPVKGYEIIHYRSGDSAMDCSVVTAITGGGATAQIPAASINGSLTMFPDFSTISVGGVAGYKEGSASETQGTLMLFVVSNDGTKLVVKAINGPLTSADTGATTVPNIPVGSTLSVCVNACHESQMNVSPENYQPRRQVMYLQKKIMNYVITDHFKEILKKTPYAEADIKADALYKFRRKCSRTAWIGAQSKFLVNVGNNMGEQYIYTQKGILRQLTNLYGIGDSIDYADLIAITKLQFTDYSQHKVAEAYCGKNFIEKLLNIDFTKHHDIEFKSSMQLGIDISSFKTSFGTINFKHDPTLDDLGYQDYCVVVDMKGASRYVKTDNKESEQDMKKGVGDNQEATRKRVMQIDAICLKGYNSMLVGPSKTLANMNVADAATSVRKVSVVPTNPSDGMLIFLTAANSTLNLDANTVYQYNAGTGTWTEYTGVAVAM